MPITTDDLWGAAGRGDVERILHHLDSGVDVNARGQAGINALGYAAFEGHADAVRTLLARGADPNGIGYHDGMPLGLAAWAGQVVCIHLLLDAGADISRGHATNGESPLHHASIKNRIEAVATLLSRGADVNHRASQGGGTELMPEPTLSGEIPLHMAAVGGSLELIRALLAGGADPLLQTHRGETPRDLARRVQRDLEIIAAL
jgi:ankyrin repeat protein